MIQAQLIKGKYNDVRVRVTTEDEVRVVALEEYNKTIPVPIVPPPNWKA